MSALSILSLNCWGLYFVSKKRQYRLQAIAHYLNQGEYDIIALQEVWMWKDYIYIKETLESKLPFAIYFHSGTLGSGLAMFSRYPILSSNYIKFTLAGKPLKVFEGDFYVGKGCGSVCIDVPNTGLIDVYTTHLQAAYNNNDQYEAQRITECWQIANAVRSSAAQNRQVILTGDFNSIPTSFCYQILKDHGFMTDSWLEMHQDNIKNTLTQFEQYELNASECIQGFGITCDSPHNSWTKRILKQHPFAKDIGDRLDYIFYRRTNELCCIKSKVIMEEYIPHTQWSYSDHFAVHSLFALNNPPKEVITPTAIEMNRPDLTHLQESTLQGIIALIQSDLTKSSQSSKRLMIIFVLSLVLILICFILQIVLAYTSYDKGQLVVALIFLFLFAVVFSIVGTVSLVVGFVYGEKEQRSLKQYLKDIQYYINHDFIN